MNESNTRGSCRPARRGDEQLATVAEAGARVAAPELQHVLEAHALERREGRAPVGWAGRPRALERQNHALLCLPGSQCALHSAPPLCSLAPVPVGQFC